MLQVKDTSSSYLINGNSKIHERYKPVGELYLRSQEISGIHGQEEYAPCPTLIPSERR